MKIRKLISTVIGVCASFLLMGCSSGTSQSGTPSLFNTKTEAEKAAKDFNCTGAHKMGDKWMPCKTHKDQKENQGSKKHSRHEHHNH